MDKLIENWPLVVLVVSYIAVLQFHILKFKKHRFFAIGVFLLHIALLLAALFIGASLPELLLCLLVGDLPVVFGKRGQSE